jgi:hypothetical protein
MVIWITLLVLLGALRLSRSFFVSYLWLRVMCVVLSFLSGSLGLFICAVIRLLSVTLVLSGYFLFPLCCGVVMDYSTFTTGGYQGWFS